MPRYDGGGAGGNTTVRHRYIPGGPKRELPPLAPNTVRAKGEVLDRAHWTTPNIMAIAPSGNNAAGDARRSNFRRNHPGDK